MNQLPVHIKKKFFDLLYKRIELKDFEEWVYKNDELEKVLDEDQHLDLISFNFQKPGASFELSKLISDRYVNIPEYEKWRLLNLLNDAKKEDERLPEILEQFYDMYYHGHSYLKEMAMAYGIDIVSPPNHEKNWSELTEKEQEEILERFKPRLQTDLNQVIDWIESEKVILNGEKNRRDEPVYIDNRTKKESFPRIHEVKSDNTKKSKR